MNRLLLIILCVLPIALLGCKKDQKVEETIIPIDLKNGRLILHEGIKYYVPLEPGAHSDAPGEFRFECEGLRVFVTNKRIYVNGKKFGTIKEGDTVSFLNKGYVFVNGELRKPEE